MTTLQNSLTSIIKGEDDSSLITISTDSITDLTLGMSSYGNMLLETRDVIADYQFKPNNVWTRNSITYHVSKHFENMGSAIVDYKITCDETNNSLITIEAGRLNVDCSFKVAYSANVMNVGFSFDGTGNLDSSLT